jgi:hypothetical protein
VARMSGRGKDLEKHCEKLLSATGGFWHRNEPPVQAGYKLRGGIPDYVVILDGRPHYIECKAGAGASLRLGSLVAPLDGAAEPAGISSAQSAVMDGIERAGGACYVLARLTHKAGEVDALIPWAVWRGWLASGLRSASPEALAGAAVSLPVRG